MKAILYQDKNRQWRWKIVAGNGRKIANCGESYRRRIDCLRILDRILTGPKITVYLEKIVMLKFLTGYRTIIFNIIMGYLLHLKAKNPGLPLPDEGTVNLILDTIINSSGGITIIGNLLLRLFFTKTPVPFITAILAKLTGK